MHLQFKCPARERKLDFQKLKTKIPNLFKFLTIDYKKIRQLILDFIYNMLTNEDALCPFHLQMLLNWQYF